MKEKDNRNEFLFLPLRSDIGAYTINLKDQVRTISEH